MEENKKLQEEIKKVEEKQPGDTLAPKVENEENGVNPDPATTDIELNSNPKVEDESESETIDPKPTENKTEENVTAKVDTAPVPDSPNKPEHNPELKFSQQDVDNFIGKTRMDTRRKTYESIYGKYGVKDEGEMDALVGNAQKFDSLKGKYEEDTSNLKKENDDLRSQLDQVQEEISLIKSGIDPKRYEDAKFILKGKGLPINEESIQQELATHPEWLKQEEPVEKQHEKEVSIEALGNDPDKKVEPEESEEEKAMKLFHI